MRGIDGGLPGDNPSGSASAQGNSKISSPTDLPEIVERPPEGRTQYDYLKRLRHRLQTLPNVKAIGVVGSDVYDKLLVLRALKPEILAKGGTYSHDEVVGWEVVESYGGKIETVAAVEGLSTTNIVERIRSSNRE